MPMPDIPLIPWSENLRSLALRHGRRTAVIDAGGATSYRALCDAAHGVAAGLAAAGLPPAARVGVLLSNGAGAVAADYGVTLSGRCLVHLNPAYTAEELRWSQRIAPAEAVIAEPALAGKAQSLGVPVLDIGELIGAGKRTVDAGSNAAMPPPPIAPALPPVPGDRESRIVFTSGSSGKPKAVLYDHARRWTGAVLLRATLPFVPDAGSRILLMTPYVHGASMLARAWIDSGGSVALHRGVDPDEVRRMLAARDIDAMFAPPTVLSKLVDALRGETFDALRCIFTGTQVLTERLYADARAIFGPRVRVTYGKSENLNPITVLDCADTEAVYASAAQAPLQGACLGYPAPGVEVAISPAQEILIRSQHGFCGYLGEAGLQPHGRADWHATGDLGYLDEAGRLWLVGRNSDVINTGGYKVHPEEIEAALLDVPSLKEAYVVGIPSAYWSEVVACVYVEGGGNGDAPDDGAGSSANDGAGGRVGTAGAAGAADAADRLAAPPGLDDALATLSGHKRPRCFVRVDRVEKTALGKVSRKALQAYVLQHYELEDGPRPRLRPRRAA